MSSLCGRQCEKCKLNKKYCEGCSLCEAAICAKNCKTCYAMCFRRPLTAAYIDHIGGPAIELPSNQEITIPIHIPILPDRFRNRPPLDLLPVIGVHGGNAFARNGERVNKSYLEKGYSGALNLDDRTEGILEFYVKDRTLEGFWDKRRSIYPTIRDLKFTAVIAPNYSVYEDAPRVDHIYNIKRSSIVYGEMLDAGIPAVPDISWFNRKDLERWIEQINKNKIRTIAFSFQVVDVGMKTSNIWRISLLGFRHLCQNIDPGTTIIIAGIVSPFRVVEIFRAASGQKIRILNQSAYVQSRRGMDSETRRQESQMPFDELFEKNIKYFNSVYVEMSNSFNEDSSGNLFNTILQWDKTRIQEFYYDYNAHNSQMSDKYGIEKEKLELAFSIIGRQIRKKKIKI